MKILATYGIIGFIRLMRDYIITRLFFKKCRLIRNPTYIRGKKYIHFGRNLTTGVNLRIDAFNLQGGTCPAIIIRDNVELNDYVHIASVNRVEIGHNVLIASKVFITDHNHGDYSGDNQADPQQPPKNRLLTHSPVIIEDNVWLGEYVVVLPGVKIGFGSIIGAHTVVNKDIPAYSMAVGIPAKVIKRYNETTKAWEKV